MLIAVGRVDINRLPALSSSDLKPLSVFALLFKVTNNKAKAAHIPIAGAPLTTSDLIALAISR
jgi:hypothetical protein